MSKKNSQGRQSLFQACLHGGSNAEIRALLSAYRFKEEDIEEAIEVLSSTISSALENNLANRNIDMLKRYLRGMKLSKSYKQK